MVHRHERFDARLAGRDVTEQSLQTTCYTHRVEISNHRLVDCEDGEVTFRYRDRRDGDRVKQEVLSAEAFVARFLQHVLAAQTAAAVDRPGIVIMFGCGSAFGRLRSGASQDGDRQSDRRSSERAGEADFSWESLLDFYGCVSGRQR